LDNLEATAGWKVQIAGLECPRKRRFALYRAKPAFKDGLNLREGVRGEIKPSGPQQAQ